MWEIHALGHQTGRGFGNGSALNELAQHPVMVQLGIVQVEMPGVVQQRGLPVQLAIVQLTRYRGLPGLQQQRAALLVGKAGALQQVGHPLEPLRPLARRQGSAPPASPRIDAPGSPGVWDAG